MSDNLRSQMIRLAASMPKGSIERKDMLNVLSVSNANPKPSSRMASLRTVLNADLRIKDGTVFHKGETAEVSFSKMSPSVATILIGDRTVHIKTMNLFRYLRGFQKPPGMRSLEMMSENARATTVTGKRNVEPDGYGPDGSPSWLLALGFI